MSHQPQSQDLKSFADSLWVSGPLATLKDVHVTRHIVLWALSSLTRLLSCLYQQGKGSPALLEFLNLSPDRDPKKAGGMAQWLRYFLCLGKSGVQLPALTSGNSQLPLTPSPEALLTPALTCTYLHTDTRRHRVQNKTNLPRAVEMAQQGQVLAAKRDDVSSSPGIHRMEGEN